MAENFVLKMILDGISALETKDELEVMRNAVNDHLTEFPQRTLRFLTEAEIVALAKGNSEDMIRVNKEKYDYSGVRVKDLPKAEKWFMAPPPSWKTHQEYYQWRVWNVAKTKEGKDIKNYKGGLIVEKASVEQMPSIVAVVFLTKWNPFAKSNPFATPLPKFNPFATPAPPVPPPAPPPPPSASPAPPSPASFPAAPRRCCRQRRQAALKRA
jgi:hypothetical protein